MKINKIWFGLALLVTTGVVANAQLPAGYLRPTGGSYAQPSGSNNGSNNGGTTATAFRDDVYLNSINFGTNTFAVSNNQFSNVRGVRVVSGREYVNAEFGTLDNGTDGNANPFVKAGIISEGQTLTSAIRESTDAAIQDAALTAAFSSFSLVEGWDGEGSLANGTPEVFSVDMIYNNGILDNDNAVDAAPEILFFERGINSDFSVQAILGGTVENPILGSTVQVLRTHMGNTGRFIETIELQESAQPAQQLGAIGLDLSVFGLAANQPLYGVRITALNDSGPDLYGTGLSALAPGTQFVPQIIPEPGVLSLVGVGLALLVGVMRNRSRRA